MELITWVQENTRAFKWHTVLALAFIGLVALMLAGGFVWLLLYFPPFQIVFGSYAFSFLLVICFLHVIMNWGCPRG